MGKKLGIVVFWLIDEAGEVDNKKLEEEIKKEVEKLKWQIPWMEKLAKAMVFDAWFWMPHQNKP